MYPILDTNLTFIVSYRQLSRHLVGLWTAENPTALNLLKRILVIYLLKYCNVGQYIEISEMRISQ